MREKESSLVFLGVMSGDLFTTYHDSVYEIQYGDKMRWLVTLVAGALGYPEDDRLLIDLTPKATQTYAPSTEGTSRPPSPTPPRFERGLWDSDRLPEPKTQPGRPTAAFVFNVNAALADVKSVSTLVRSLDDILRHASDEVMTRFAELVAAHFARSIQTTGGRRHYSLKPAAAMFDIGEQLEWFALLEWNSERNQFIFGEPRRITIREALNRGLNFYH